MRASEVPRAVAAGMACAAALELRVDDAVVVHNSNRLAVCLLPCEVLARLALAEAQAGAEFEILVARRFAETDSPVAELHVDRPGRGGHVARATQRPSQA